METYNIFVSHAWKYSDDYNKVVEWLDEAQKEGTLKWKNYSVPEHDPVLDPNKEQDRKALEKALDAQIKPTSKVIIISGMYAAYSSWIDFEIDTAISYKKTIIGLEPWGQQHVPLKIQKNADKMVGWNKKSLINAILNF